MSSPQMVRTDSLDHVLIPRYFLDSVKADVQKWCDDLAGLQADLDAFSKVAMNATASRAANSGGNGERQTFVKIPNPLVETACSSTLQIPHLPCPPSESVPPSNETFTADSISVCGDKSDNGSIVASQKAASHEKTTSANAPTLESEAPPRRHSAGDLMMKKLPTWLCEPAASKPEPVSDPRGLISSTMTFQEFEQLDWDEKGLQWLVTAIRYVVRGKWFDFAVGALILINIALIGWEQSAVISGRNTQGFRVAEHCFLVVYIFEISLRIVSEGKRMFKSHLFLFDMVLVAIGVVSSWIVGPVVTLTESDVQGVLDKLFIFRTLRLLRLVRALRLFVQFKTIWRLVNGLMNSVDILMSTCMLLIITLYCFASVGLEIFALNHTLRVDPTADALVEEYMSSLPVMMLTLVRFVTLDDLAQVFTPMLMEQPILTIYYLLVILIVSITLMNLVTALLVEKAIQNAKVDVETKRFHRQARLRSLTPQIRKIFRQLDKDGSGSVTKQEVMEALGKYDGQINVPPTLRDIFFSDSVMELFDLLDADYSGQIDEDEFVGGVIQMAMTDIPLETRQILKIQRFNTKKIEHIETMIFEWMRDQ